MSASPQHLRQLIESLLNETIDDAEHAELERLLESSSEARRIYRQSVELEFELRQRQIGEYAATSLPDVRPTPHSVSWRRWSLAAMLLMAVGLLIVMMMNRQDKPTGETVARTFVEVIQVSGEIDESLQPGKRLGAEWIRLKSGAMLLAFDGGAMLSVEGPAALRMEDGSSCYVESGRVVVLGPSDGSGFILRTKHSRVIDIGTEFAATIDSTGIVSVHVLEGEVRIAKTAESDEQDGRLLKAKEAARFDPTSDLVESISFEGEAFESMRPTVLRRNRPLRLQFDCGATAGLYSGSQSPAHADGTLGRHEATWNLVVGDQSGTWLTADGSTVLSPITIDFGHGTKQIDWDVPLKHPRGRISTRGVFDNALGKDCLTGSHGGGLAVGVTGLPPGRYRVYLIARSTSIHKNWGNDLKNKAYDIAIGVNLEQIPKERLQIQPVVDSEAKSWVEGQTHVVQDVVIKSSQDRLTMIMIKNRDRSPRPAGGNSPIQGFQIIQLNSSQHRP